MRYWTCAGHLNLVSESSAKHAINSLLSTHLHPAQVAVPGQQRHISIGPLGQPVVLPHDSHVIVGHHDAQIFNLMMSVVLSHTRCDADSPQSRLRNSTTAGKLEMVKILGACVVRNISLTAKCDCARHSRVVARGMLTACAHVDYVSET